MTVDHGMNIDEVKALADHLKSVSRTLEQMTQQINSRVSSSSWVGPDAARFKNEWWPGHRGQLQKVHADLDGFAQSALNNATEQERASEGGGDGGGSAAFPVATVAVGTVAGGVGAALAGGATAPAPDAGAVTAAGRPWTDAQSKYDAWAASNPGGQTRFGPGGESQYQCTGWANFRWAELGYKGPPISGHGGVMAANAPGDVSGTPSLHAMASYRSGDYGHVMIVEEMSADGSRIRVSEMNTGISEGNPNKWDAADLVAHPDEYKDTNWITRQPDGTFKSWNGNVIEFAALPG